MTNPPTPDLTPEAVERMASGHENSIRILCGDRTVRSEEAATLRALSAALEDERAERGALDAILSARAGCTDLAIIKAKADLKAAEAERDALKAQLAEALGLLKVALKAVNWSFSAGTEEREGGSGRRQGKLLDQIRPFETDARAFLASIEGDKP